jgi:hypothetical protein
MSISNHCPNSAATDGDLKGLRGVRERIGCNVTLAAFDDLAQGDRQVRVSMIF